MSTITKVTITPYSAKQMYALVSDIANYKQYLPWCSNSTILSEEGNIIIARVNIEYLKVTTHFTTKNINTLNQRIDMSLVDGPFRHLQGCWQFTPLGEHGSKIEFQLDYTFNNIIIEKVIGAVFELIIRNIVDSFIKKANQIYSNQ